MLCNSFPGHHVFNNLQATRNSFTEAGNNKGTFQKAQPTRSEPSPVCFSIRRHISRAVLPVLAMCCLARLAYLSVILMLAWQFVDNRSHGPGLGVARKVQHRRGLEPL